MRLYAEWGVALFVVVLLLAWWRARQDNDPKTMAAALWAPAGALLAIGLNQPLSNVVHAPRPYTVLPDALVLVAQSPDYSFPSDHAVTAGAVAGGVLLIDRRLGAAIALAAVVMAFARVYIGAHFPLDVIVGLVLGAAVTSIGFLVARPLLIQIVTGLTRTPLRPLLTSTGGSLAP